MSLPNQEQQSLDLIEGGLRGSAPWLVSMFSIFTRLANDDRIPPHETIVPSARGKVSQMAVELCLALPLALGLVAVAIFLAVSTPAAHGCLAARRGGLRGGGQPHRQLPDRGA